MCKMERCDRVEIFKFNIFMYFIWLCGSNECRKLRNSLGTRFFLVRNRAFETFLCRMYTFNRLTENLNAPLKWRLPIRFSCSVLSGKLNCAVDGNNHNYRIIMKRIKRMKVSSCARINKFFNQTIRHSQTECTITHFSAFD